VLALIIQTKKMVMVMALEMLATTAHQNLIRTRQIKISIGIGDACDNCIDQANSCQLDDDVDDIGNICEPSAAPSSVPTAPMPSSSSSPSASACADREGLDCAFTANEPTGYTAICTQQGDYYRHECKKNQDIVDLAWSW
jgi:hypothetical protein